MKTRFFYTFVLIVLVTAVFATSSAEAASGAGPYYATPSWDEKLACPTKTNCPRFEVLTNWGSAAVLDKETGLIWEQAPQAPTATEVTWEAAQERCNLLTTGGRLGWRLPTLQELASLIDPTQIASPYSKPALPPGHPFSNIQAYFYWSATIYFSGTTGAWDLNLANPSVDIFSITTAGDYCWCVRGGKGVDLQ